MTVAIEDKQNHARRAFEDALRRRQELGQDQQKQGERKVQTLYPELKPKGLGGKRQQQPSDLQAAASRSSRIENAYKKAKGGLTERTIKQDFDRAR